MSKRRLVDTNLIVRYLVQDDDKHAKIARKLIASCDEGEITLVILPTVMAECVFVLQSFYEHARGDIAQVLADLIESPGIDLIDGIVHLDALRRYRESKCHFVDCTIAAYAVAGDLPVATFDDDFQKFPDVRVEND